MPAGAPNLFGYTQYDNRTSFFEGSPPLPQGVGYGVVLGFGVFFGVATSALVRQYQGSPPWRGSICEHACQWALLPWEG